MSAYTLTCTCGWTHEASTRPSATTWAQWHRAQWTPKGSRPSDTGHTVKILRPTAK